MPSAGTLTITFHNGSALAHNLVFTSGISVSTGSIVEPGSIERLSVAPLKPGRYRFVCTIHEGMAGSLRRRGSDRPPLASTRTSAREPDLAASAVRLHVPSRSECP